jgi:FKBP-type peptidyl-prolyl cis-trans isomerase FklB
MKKILLFFFCSVIIASVNAQEKIVFANEKDSASYAAGLNEGERMMMMLEQSGADTILNQPLFFKGFNDYIIKQPQLNLDIAKVVLQSYFTKFQALLEEKQRSQDEEYKKMYEGNKIKSIQFLEENKKKEGIITTTSGLQYQIIKKGKGKNIQLGDMIKVGYKGTLTDGSLVDSISKSTPYELELTEGSLIPGWTEVLLLMKKGSQYKVFIPYDLGYGDMGKEPDIPPYAVLVFDLEVVDHTPNK